MDNKSFFCSMWELIFYIESLRKQTFIIWCPTSDKPITTVYYSGRQADRVASSMARKFPGEQFHVMRLDKTYMEK